MKEHRREFYQKCLDKWGEKSQVIMCIEEMSELTKELCKYYRYIDMDKGKAKINEAVKDIKEEIADVLNMLEQIQFIFGEEQIENIREEKINRTLNKMF